MATKPQQISPTVRKVKPADASFATAHRKPVADVKKVQVDPITELHQQVVRLRQAIKIWLKADVAYAALSNIQEGSANMPIIDIVLPNTRDGNTANLSFDLARISEPDAAAVVDTLLGASVADYEESLLEIVTASQAAYSALQKQKVTM